MLNQKVEWIYEEGNEAIINVSDGNIEITCFAHPYDASLSLSNKHIFYGVDTSHIVKNFNQTFLAERINKSLAFAVNGRVLSTQDALVQVGSFIIRLDVHLPLDIVDYEYISFTCERIDV